MILLAAIMLGTVFITAHPAADSSADSTAGSATDLATESTNDSATYSTAEATPASTADSTADSTPEFTADAVVDATTDSGDGLSPVSEVELRSRFAAGDYWSVGRDGLIFLKNEPDNEELRMIVANSLAWSGLYVDAIGQYQILAGTTQSENAALGLANVYRWSGRPDLASPLYLHILDLQPDNPEALDGLTRADRELRPRTEVRLARKSDSNSVKQNGAELDHSWRGDDLAVKYAMSVNASRYTLESVNTNQRGINFSVAHADMTMLPELDLSIQQKPLNKAFASVRLALTDKPELNTTIGHVNWGYMAFHPQALLAGLSATQLGLDGRLITRPGTISAAYDYYRVSDKNRVQDANVRFSPSWRPLGADFRYYIGISGRFAEKNVATYWSPASRYLSTDIGFTNEWSSSNGDYAIYGQRGFGTGGEALDSYNMGLAAKRYLDRDWAVSLGAGWLKNMRVDAYHSKYLTFGTERLW